MKGFGFLFCLDLKIITSVIITSYALTVLGSIMEKLQSILEAHVASGEDTKDKLLGAAFVVVNKDGE